MAISPVSNLLNTNSYHVNFGSRKNKKTDESLPNSSAGMKAVPVMVLMAMSPLNASNINAAQLQGNENVIELVEANDAIPGQQTGVTERMLKLTGEDFERQFGDSKSVVKTKELTNMSMLFYSSKKDKNIDEVSLKIRPLNGSGIPEERSISVYEHVNYDIIGDDGTSGGIVSFPQIIEDDFNAKSKRYGDKELCEYIKDFIDGKNEYGLVNNNAIKERVYNKKIFPLNTSYTLQRPPKTDWLRQGAEEKENFGTTPDGMPERVACHTDKRFYAISPYTTDTNKKDFETVTVCWFNDSGAGEFKVAGLRPLKIKFLDDSGEIKAVTLKSIELYKRNSTEKAVIFDNELYDTLQEVTKDTRYNNAFKCYPVTEKKFYSAGRYGIRYSR